MKLPLPFVCMLAPFEYGVAPSGWKATSLVIFPNTACNRQLRRRCQKFGPMWTKIAEVGVFAMLFCHITHGSRIAQRLYLGFLEALLLTATISRLECSANHRFPQFLSITDRIFGIGQKTRRYAPGSGSCGKHKHIVGHVPKRCSDAGARPCPNQDGHEPGTFAGWPPV